MELEECIKDALDDSLQNYTHSVEYIQEKQEINEKLQSFRKGYYEVNNLLTEKEKYIKERYLQ